MKNITIIAAVGKNYELGKDNRLIWHLPEDLKFFKEQTINKPIVMGKNTLDSLPKLLPNRLHLVLTHQNIEENDQLKVFHTKEKLLEYINNLEEVMIIGGAKIYEEFIEYATKIILTEIDQEYDADVYFPKFNKDEWYTTELSTHIQDGVKYKHILYEKKDCLKRF